MHKKQATSATLWLFAIGVFMASLDNGIVTAALSTLTDSFGVHAAWGAWSITIYTLGLVVSMPIAGKTSAQYGRKWMFLIAVFLFGIGSFLVAWSTEFSFFLVARMIQAFGGGGMLMIASAYVLDRFPKEMHGRALGLLGGMNGVAALLGPNVGAIILGLSGSWHWLFLINVPIAIGLLFWGWRALEQTERRKDVNVNWVGIGTFGAGMVAIMYSVTQLDGVNVLERIQQPRLWGALIAGMFLLYLCCRNEQRISRQGNDPFIPLYVLTNRNVRLTMLLGFFSGVILAAVLFIPTYVEQFLGVDAAHSGYWFTPFALASGIGAGGSGVFVDRKGPIPTMMIAATLCMLGFVLFPLWVLHGWQFIVASGLVGLGFGMMLGAPLQVLATDGSTGEKGVTLSTLTLMRQIGLILFPSLFAGFLVRQLSAWHEQTLKPAMHYLDLWVDEVDGITALTNHAALDRVLQQVSNPMFQEELSRSYSVAIQQGFDGLFWTAGGISLLALITTFVIKAGRN